MYQQIYDKNIDQNRMSAKEGTGKLKMMMLQGQEMAELENYD